jgi:hypothetical protein
VHPHIETDLQSTTQGISKQHTIFTEKQSISEAHYSFYSVLILFINITIPLFETINKLPKYHM